MDNVAWDRLAKWVGLPFFVWAILAWATDAAVLNPILILIVICVSVSVCVAFLPNVFLFFRKDRTVDIFAMVAFGVFVGWLSNILRPSIPLVIELFPSLGWVRESDFASLGFCVAIWSGLLHLLAPSIDGHGKVPSKRWAKIGIIVGIGVAIGFVALNWTELGHMIRRDEEGARPAVFHGVPASRVY